MSCNTHSTDNYSCTFWIEYSDGTRTEWRSLTKAEAIKTYKTLSKSYPGNVTGIGWDVDFVI